MQITRSSTLDTNPGPSDYFTGTVFVDAVAAPVGPSRTTVGAVHFAPGARTAWHTHPLGQTIYIVEGAALCQREGDPIVELGVGDRVFFEPGENHWHGATPNRFMVHLAVTENDESGNVDWGVHVSDEQYGAAHTND
jgi:quercetin dioxygenase-like cupin family protein